jgi:hypothetical protein
MEARPIYEFSVRFFSTYLQINPETGLRYLRLGVIEPDALTTTGKPLFGVDADSVARHQKAIKAYRAGLAAAAHNIKDLRHVSV